MNKVKIGLFLALIVSVGIAISACSGKIRYAKTSHPEYKVKRTGPPAHAPAHGYRFKHSHGVFLVYESAIGVYVVSDHSHHYFHKNKYYRLKKGSWEISSRLDGPWKPIKEKKLPPGLQKRKSKGKE